MERKFCNHCGRLYTDKCTCIKDKVKKEYKTRENFYDRKEWRKLSLNVRIRDFNIDRLQLYFCKFKPEGNIEKQLYDFLMDTNNQPRSFDGRIVVHHIEPLEDDWKKRLQGDNLISLNYHTHEYVHQLYFNHKEAVQALLKKAVQAELP